MTTIPTYWKVRRNDTSSMIVKAIRERHGSMAGYECNRDGEIMERKVKDGVSRHLVLFHMDDIICEMVMSHKYATLEPR